MTTTNNTKEKRILMVGERFTASSRRERPRLTFFPQSLLNSQKALACVAFSSLEYKDVELNIINCPEDNQTLEFARINPNMTIPVLEIDDKIITDSRDIQRYLTNKYPGKGDAEANKETIESFNDCVCTWDEYLFSYRRIPIFLGAAIHNIRLVCQVISKNSKL